MVQDSPSRKMDQFIVRLPDGMRDRIRAAAEENNRSMNAEIVATLEEKYPAPSKAVRLDMLEFFLEGYEAKLQYALANNDAKEAERFRAVIETIKRDIEEYDSGCGDGSGLGDGAGYGDGSGDGYGDGSGYGYGDGNGDGYGDGDGAYGDSDGNGDGTGGRS